MNKTHILSSVDPKESGETSPIIQQSLRRDQRELASASASASPSPVLTGARRVLVRRKALQDFYKLPQRTSGELDSSPNKERNSSVDSELELDQGFFGSEAEFAAFAAKTPLVEILRHRNAATRRLDAHDLAKKGMIYDNYYQLIQLSHTLDKLSSPQCSTSVLDSTSSSPTPSLDSIDAVVNDLKSFVETHSVSIDSLFNQLLADFTHQDQEGLPLRSPPPERVISEINTLLDVEPKRLSASDKLRLSTDVSKMLESCAEDSLLKNQLKSINDGLK